MIKTANKIQIEISALVDNLVQGHTSTLIIKKLLFDLFTASQQPVPQQTGGRAQLIVFHEWLQENTHYGYFITEFIIDKFLESHPSPTAPSDAWISVEDRLPDMIVGKDYSENVFAWCDNRLMVMGIAYLQDDNGNFSSVWCNCHGCIEGDAEFDDNYLPTHWMPLPPPPKK
jgi:hypothetical protein